jgi:hypothetical protein
MLKHREPVSSVADASYLSMTADLGKLLKKSIFTQSRLFNQANFSWQLCSSIFTNNNID